MADSPRSDGVSPKSNKGNEYEKDLASSTQTFQYGNLLELKLDIFEQRPYKVSVSWTVQYSK